MVIAAKNYAEAYIKVFLCPVFLDFFTWFYYFFPRLHLNITSEVEIFSKIVSYFTQTMYVIWIRGIFLTLKNIFYKHFLLFIADNYCHCKLSGVNGMTLDVVKLVSFKHGSIRNKDLINSILRSVFNICKQSNLYFLDSHFPKD